MNKTPRIAKKIIISPYEEKEYAKELLSLVSDFKVKVNEELSQLSLTRTDDTIDDLNKLVAAVQSFIGLKVAKLLRPLKARAERINKAHLQAFTQSVEHIAVGGVSILPLSLKAKDVSVEMRLWVAENTLLIKSIPEQALTKLQVVILQAARSGESPRSLAKSINELFKVNRNRAKLIARDQLGKIYGSLTRLRNLEIGIKTYIFSTSDDERVRHSHRVLDGKTCSWLDAEIYKDGANDNWHKRSSIGGVLLHPGQDFQCRCTSKAIVAGVL